MAFTRQAEALRLGSINPFLDGLYWGKSVSSPPAPDYAGAATATAAGNKENTIAAQQGSMVNQYTPYGSMTYEQTGNWDGTGNPQYAANISLDPRAQYALDTQLNLSNQMGDLASGQVGRVQSVFNTPFDTSQIPSLQNFSRGSDVAYKAATDRLDPQWAASTAAQENKLANQGITQGSEAYNNAMREFNNAKNDAYGQARAQALSQGLNEAQLNNATSAQAIQQQEALRNIPLNELNAFRTGTQIQNPQFTSTPSQQYTPGANYLGAAQAQGQWDQGLYNSQVGAANSTMSGIFGLGSAALSNPWVLSSFSDRRLKSNIRQLATHRLGIGIYEYDIFGIRTIGVMADEVERVLPDAVITLPSGYQAVNYGRL